MSTIKRITALAYLAARFRDRGDAANAIVTFRQALAIKSDDATTLLHLGMTYSNAGDLESAMTCYQQAANLAPDNAMIFVNWGMALRQKGDTNGAIEKYQKALAINPHLALAHFALARAYIKFNQPQSAAPALRAGLQYDSGNENAKQTLQQLETFLSNR